MTNFDFSALPRWVFSFAALIIAISAGYGMFYAECTTKIFGLEFGQNRVCAREDSGLVKRLDALEAANTALQAEVKNLATRDRNSIELTITNRGQGNTDGCPEGTFVSAISAPGGVGGRYATDGINKISYKCSPVVSE